MRKIIAFLLIFAIFVQPAVAAPDLSSASDWAREDIMSAIEKDLVPEELQGNYTANITRAEFCALAVALYETVTGEEIAGRVMFDDTDDVYVQKAAYIGVVTGVGNNRFNPDVQLTREQAAVMLARLANALEKPLPANPPTFADNDDMSPWAFDSVGQIQAAGIMGGTGNNMFSPGNPYTREQSIVTILRLYNILN
jgi:hypothetical protein